MNYFEKTQEKSRKIGTEIIKLDKEIIQKIIGYLKVVENTFGPCGKSVLLEDSVGNGKMTQDGANIIHNISPGEKEIKMVFNEIKKTVERISTEVGDGTTTSIILGIALLEQMKEFLTLDHTRIEKIMEGIVQSCDKATAIVNNFIEKITINNHEKIRQVAAISSKDEELGQLIQNAYVSVGTHGIVEVSKSNSMDTILETANGFAIDKGYINVGFVTNSEKLIAELQGCHILIYHHTLSVLQGSFLTLLSEISKEGKSLLIIAEGITGVALDILLMNKKAGNLKCICIGAPSFGNYRRDILDDMAMMTGATIIDDQYIHIKDVTKDHLGFCKQVKVSHNETRIIEGKENKEKIQEQKKSIQYQIKNLLLENDKKYELDILRKRLARFEGGVCCIKVGGMNESDQNERYDLVQDAIAAVKGALETGIYTGGGITLLKIYNELERFFNIHDSNRDFNLGVQIFRSSLLTIVRTILKNNTNVTDPKYKTEVIINTLLEHHNKNSTEDFGFDVKRGIYINNMNEEGIIDSAKIMLIAIPYMVHQIKSIIGLQYIVLNHNNDNSREYAEG